MQTVIILLVCAACTFSERLLPFVVFGRNKPPEAINYLGRVLPLAVITSLVFFCFRSTSFNHISGFAPQFIAGGLTAALHAKFGNTLLSIVCGTVCYMLLVQFVF